MIDLCERGSSLASLSDDDASNLVGERDTPQLGLGSIRVVVIVIVVVPVLVALFGIPASTRIGLLHGSVNGVG